MNKVGKKKEKQLKRLTETIRIDMIANEKRLRKKRKKSKTFDRNNKS